MDLNYLFYRQQVSLMRANTAGCREARRAHLGLARGYGDAIRTLQRELKQGAPH
jgi:hypothetical protein